MSILIKNAEMPDCCNTCPCCQRVFACRYGGSYCGATGMVIVDLGEISDDCPLIEVPTVVRGKWIKPTRVPDSILSECSVCGFAAGAYMFNFCPNCGADMRKPRRGKHEPID